MKPMRTGWLRTRWAALTLRERRMLAIAAWLFALALAWWVALAPALHLLRSAPAEHARLDTQLQQMTLLQAQAEALRTQARPDPREALHALQESTGQHLGGAAQVQGAGESIRITLRGAHADALAQWLAQARDNAHALPQEAHLTRTQTTASDGSARPNHSVQWDGTLTMRLPTAP